MLSPLSLVATPVDAVVAFDADITRRVGKAVGPPLGDRICLALAKAQGVSALIADKAWKPLAAEIGVGTRLQLWV